MNFNPLTPPPELFTLNYLGSVAAATTPPNTLPLTSSVHAAGGLAATLPANAQPWWMLPAAGVWEFTWKAFNISGNVTGTFRRVGLVVRAISLGDVPAFVNSEAQYPAATIDMLGAITLAIPPGYQIGMAIAHDATGLVGMDAHLHARYCGPCVAAPYPYDLAVNP